MNRSIVFILLVSFCSFSCAKKVALTVKEPVEETTTKPTTTAVVPFKDAAPKMTFENRVLDLGKIKKGAQIPLSYTFKNTGDADLEIDLISVCDCTKVLERPYSAIKPGESGTIKAIFDSNQKEESETIEIDIWLKNIDPVLDMPVLERVKYVFEFE